MDFIFDPSLVLYLPMYELNGSSFMSRDAYGHLCTVTGALWKPYGRYFDGDDDYITVPTHTSLRPTTEGITIELWLYYQGGETLPHLICKRAANVGYRVYMLGTEDPEEIVFVLGKSGGEDSVSSDTSIAKNVWTHIAATWDTSEMALFFNSQKDANTTARTAAIDWSSTPSLKIGDFGTQTRVLLGLIGEVAVYNRALTPLEIQHNYLATKWRYQ